ncbi:hypothetical protein HY449_01125 [Candidatus Pacearchaeota archaeon]|nr:hypothetical protein [Candidatus Pacearchaeota archaeon]
MYNPLIPFRESDNLSSILIKKEFRRDLESAAIICSISEEKRDACERLLLNLLMQKYSRSEVSPLEKYASKDSRQEFDVIREEIRRVVYN